jgi:hypothetical protein
MSGTKENISIRSQIKAQLTRPPKDAHDKFGNLSMQEKILDRIKYHTDFLIIDNFNKERSRYHIIKLEILKEMLEEGTKIEDD